MARKDRLSLFVFIDAFGWDILQRNRFLEDELPVRSPLGTVMGYSSTCIPTILTGKMPREHGHFSFFYYSPETSPFAACRYLSILPRSITRRGRLRRLMSRALQRYYGFTGYFQIYNMPFRHLPLFDYSEKADLYAPGGINNGCPTIFDLLRSRQVPFHLSDWRAAETLNFAKAEQDLRQGQVELAYLYMADMDALLHAKGTQSPLIAEKIRWYEEKIRSLLAVARSQYGEVRLHVFSDHGQADIKQLCPLIERIDRTGLKFASDYVAVYDSTMARFWFFTDAARRAIPAALSEEPLGRTLTPEEVAANGCNFPGNKFGELFFLLKPGVLLCPSFLGEVPLAAMHGYETTDKDSIAMIASSASPLRKPARLDDMYALIAAEAEWAATQAKGARTSVLA